MKYYLVTYHVVEDYISCRTPFREDHLRLAREACERGELILAGALSNPADAAVFVFRCRNQSIVEEFIQNDPYVREGLVPRWEIRHWNVVVE